MHIKGQYKEVISSVNVVAGTFYVASFQKKDIQKVSHALLRIFLLRSTPHFFSYNEAFGQVTLVLDSDSLSTFPGDSLTVSPHGWRALEVTLGDCGYTESGIISRLSSALAKHKISIHYLSTYNTDYILVPENQLTNAINCFTYNFNIEITADADESTVDDGVMFLNTPDLPPMHAYNEDKDRKLVLSPASLCLASVDKDDLPLCMDSILHMIFFPKREEFHFLSFTETPSELSIILDQQDINDFPQISCMSRLLIETYPWRAIKRVDKSLFGETEIVNAVSTALADANISLLYLSVSNTSIILVRENKLKEAISTLRDNGFDILESNISI